MVGLIVSTNHQLNKEKKLMDYYYKQVAKKAETTNQPRKDWFLALVEMPGDRQNRQIN